MRKRLKITLKSDLCAGSGYAFAGIIDSDICYDKYGIPYIPGRRLKGCLREAAQMIGHTEEELNAWFGKKGASVYEQMKATVTGVFLGDAYVEGYEDLQSGLASLTDEMKEYITTQSILEQFTGIKAQTGILENGMAKKNSLRFTRKVNHYSPLEHDAEMVFVADVELVGLTEQEVEIFQQAVKALRNIGLDRNRGLGSVKCQLTDVTNQNQGKEVDESQQNEVIFLEDEAQYTLLYSIRNMAPLVLPGRREDQTERYISGQSVMGCIASAYLGEGNDADSELFKELFLKNQVIYSSLYPCSNGKIFYPAPAYINCRKKTKEFVNVSKDIPAESGNQPKKLKNKFVCVDKDGILLKEVGTELIFHHTKRSEKQDAQNGNLLYSFEAVSRNQTFAGTVTGPGKYIRIIYELLQRETLRFGKSKSAQYGACAIEEVGRPIENVHIMKDCVEDFTFLKEGRILVVLQSDGIFIGEQGYTVRCDEVREILKKSLLEHGIVVKDVRNDIEYYSELEPKELTGYYAKWNLKRQNIPAVCAGSAFEFCLEEEVRISRNKVICVGERIGEGYGKLQIVDNSSRGWRIIEKSEKQEIDTEMASSAKALCRKILLRQMCQTLRNAAMQTELGLQNPTTVGKIKLMLTESINAYPDDAERAYEDFSKRIASIKTDKKQEEVRKVKEKLICPSDVLDANSLKYITHIDHLVRLYGELGEEPATQEIEIKRLWSDYFMYVLAQEKYRQKGRG